MKKLVEWNDELSVGLEEIDSQHKMLVQLLNSLHEAIVTGKDDKQIARTLHELRQYTVIHFAVEESLMRIFDYPDYENHRHHHQELTKQVVDLQRKLKTGEEKLSMEVLHFLRHWLTYHIQGDDKKYAPFLLSKGLKASHSKRSWAGRMWDHLVHHDQH